MMPRRFLGPVGRCLLFLLVAGLVVGGLGWVTYASLGVESAQRTAAADADRAGKERLALWRLDGKLLPTLGAENYRKFEDYSALYSPLDLANPAALNVANNTAFVGNTTQQMFVSELAAAKLEPWMQLHVQLDPDNGWQSPQVIPPDLYDRLIDFPNYAVLSGVTDERRKLLADLNRVLPPRETARRLAELNAGDAKESGTPVTLVASALSGRPSGVTEFDRFKQMAEGVFAGILPGSNREAKSPVESNPPPGTRDAATQAPQSGTGEPKGKADPYTGKGNASNALANNAPLPVPSPKFQDPDQNEASKRAAAFKGQQAPVRGQAQVVTPAGPPMSGSPPPSPAPAGPGAGGMPAPGGFGGGFGGGGGGPGGPTGGGGFGRGANPDKKKEESKPGTGPRVEPAPAAVAPKTGLPATVTKDPGLAAATPAIAPAAPQDAAKDPPRKAGEHDANRSRGGDDKVDLKDAAGDPERQKGGSKDELKKETPPTRRAPPAGVHLGTMRPVWLTDRDGLDRLLIARSAVVTGKTLYQAVVIDWPALREALLAEVTDLFPAATLTPLPDGDPTAPERSMAALPAVLNPGPAPDLPPAGWTPLRLGLALAWIAALVALAAVWFGGWSLVDLSERRIRFVSAVTHELRTPLTSLRLYLDMLTSGMVKEEAKKQEYLTTLSTESDRLNRLIENVLDFSRLERRSAKVIREPVPVADLLARVKETWAERLAADCKDLQVVGTVPPGQTVCVDPRMVEQILGNLVDNARKYTREAADPRIWVWAKPAGRRRVTFEVEDRGPGIPVAERRTIFRPFRRGAEADTTAGGAGLGLALARQWAELCGGRLSYHPAEGGVGACFRLELPVG